MKKKKSKSDGEPRIEVGLVVQASYLFEAMEEMLDWVDKYQMLRYGYPEMFEQALAFCLELKGRIEEGTVAVENAG